MCMMWLKCGGGGEDDVVSLPGELAVGFSDDDDNDGGFR